MSGTFLCVYSIKKGGDADRRASLGQMWVFLLLLLVGLDGSLPVLLADLGDFAGGLADALVRRLGVGLGVFQDLLAESNEVVGELFHDEKSFES